MYKVGSSVDHQPHLQDEASPAAAILVRARRLSALKRDRTSRGQPLRHIRAAALASGARDIVRGGVPLSLLSPGLSAHKAQDTATAFTHLRVLSPT